MNLSRGDFTFLQSLIDEFLHLQGLLVLRLVLQEGPDVAQGPLVLLEEAETRKIWNECNILEPGCRTRIALLLTNPQKTRRSS